MIQDEIPIPVQTLQWKCIESKKEGKRLHYGRFAVSPFRKGQASTVGVAMRRALLGEVEGTSITYAKFKNVVHEYSTLVGIKESIHDILINLKEIVLQSDSYETQKASISILGPRDVTAGDILLPTSVKIIDASQHIATITTAIPLDVELRIERDCGYRTLNLKESQSGEFFIDALFTPIRNANYSIHSFESNNKVREILFLEVWTNGSLTPGAALSEASRDLIDLFIIFLNMEKEESIKEIENNELNIKNFPSTSISVDIDRMAKEVAFKQIFIDQLELPARAYNCLKKMQVHTVSDLLKYTQYDLKKVKNFGNKSVEQVVEALQERFAIQLPKDQFNIS
uniref:DNA-directed RNA polymerase subunit alpha n=2 Tax=Psilotum nudum TaxID=3240 RepID=RPOA_PSINU|nr:RNA polymerase alpha subunit [Psilotum nudum]Q8WHZ1.1 RecName: Full=DNA-directed RNA polymerase subunit alpha; Short=PEP; AltName: Full=Plastid-encoded RNA polymerase subunit alpha; Short=RNA polymerase subunit alpha [Psilotum nudum]AGC26825.1 DNA-directed RNA polymerase subunit alpha [Psilotum nudum]BAB84248.1 RNA polymerase alpha subunit [Psilotum nudum]